MNRPTATVANHLVVPAALAIATIAAAGVVVTSIADHIAEALWHQLTNEDS